MLKRNSCKLFISFITLILALHSLTVSALDAEAMDNSEFLPPAQAFILTVSPISKKTSDVHVHFKILPGYQLYQEQLSLRQLSGEIISTMSLPKPFTQKDLVLGDHKVYKDQLEFTIPSSNFNVTKGFKIQYQGCAENGFCYPPIAKQITFAHDGSPILHELSPAQFQSTVMENTAVPSASVNTDVDASEPTSESDRISALFNNKNHLITLLAFLGFGVLLAFTPCVLPMIPILANILVGQQQPLSRKRSFILSGLYVLSVATCYALAGISAGLLGSHLSTTLQQPAVLIGLGVVLVIFALSQLNLIHINPPKLLAGLFNKLENTQHKEGSMWGAVTMGAVSALVVSPCVTAPLIGALTYIGQTGDAVMGGLALFTLALGMGLPLLTAACIGGHFLPKAGSWMVHIKNITGVLLLGLAIFTFMKATPTLHTKTENPHAPSPFTTIRSTTELSNAIREARTHNKPIILDVYADWCTSCRQMDREVFENKAVLDTLHHTQLLRLDLTQQTKASAELQQKLNIVGPPMVLFFWPDGQEAKSYRLAGKPKSNNFIALINRFIENSDKRKLN